MAKRLPTLLPRIAVLVLVALAATAGLTFAAGSQVASAPDVPLVDTTPVPPLVVPDVRNQAFVFAKGTLADAGFAWRVAGSVHGYAANVVVSQSPAAGTHLIDTGAPQITLTLKRNGSYEQSGDPADASTYAGTLVEPSDLAGNPIGPVTSVTKPPATAKKPSTPAKKPSTPAKKPSAPAKTATTTAATTPVATTPTTPATPATTPDQTATTPATKTTAAAPATPATPAKTAKAAKWPQSRPVAFVVPGAKKEPLDEMPLPDRARALSKWLDAHQKTSAASAKYWLYQNEWIVTGAKFGWWRGAEALKTLVEVDKRAQTLWGIGSASAAVAQQTLDQVEAKAKS